MANGVFANGREIACKAGSGKSVAAFPDVCFTPPLTPATPPGVPIPYPNTGFESDTTQGSKTVKISGKEVMLRNKSYFSKSTGDEAGSAPKKNVVTSVNRGKVYFESWSSDVKFEGENVVRHVDLTTHNHASTPAGTPPFPDLSTLMVGGESCESIFAKEHINVHRHGSAKCPDGYESDHILQNACFQNKRHGASITTAPDYTVKDAPCICLKGKSSEVGSQHYIKTQAQNDMEKDWRDNNKTPKYKDARDGGLEAVADSRSTRPSDDAMECLKLVVDHYFKKHLGMNETDEVRVPRRKKKFRRKPKRKK
ncbi:MAG TPA: DUF4150 domain-containing protein [Gemmatimonadales bacterium]|jgi:hypothetical protein